ncbi:Proton-coupled amino acid transporter-like protein pathetic [Eumeta japonica]|uniref:Proton-coupled amino acid transporter-like protein pathetic n=1 Tax=Eumeta variegata TaxID=151549 RepID=A0A4C1SNS8_EUMVA|nr:Proton-coupled amino acid transporter-like protein pathetic [Eumeta japonica]
MSSGLRRDCPGARVRLLTAPESPDSSCAEVYRAYTDEYLDVRSFANLLKSSLGSGILAMPNAFKSAGTVVGILGTIILGYICTHCVYLLIVEHFIPNMGINTEIYCLMFLLPIVSITQIRNLKCLALFSAFANLLLVVTFIICLYFIISEFPKLDNVPMSVDIGQLPVFMGTVIFAMEGIGVVLPVENAMSKPQHFLGCPGVLNITMSVVVILYMTMGFLGYVRYGNKAEANITLNLDTNNIFAIGAKISIIAAIYCTYSLQYYVPMEIVWRNIKSHISQKFHNEAQSLMRAVCATLTVILAALFPKLEKVIGLEGAFFYSFLGLIVPTIIEIIFLWERGLGKYNWILVKDLALGFFGMFVLVTGCIQSLRNILEGK